MPSWRPFTLNMIPGVPQALDAVGQATSTLTGLLDTLAGLLETLAQLIQFLADAMQAAIAALCAMIQEIIDQIFNLLNTGIYFYLDKGPFFTGAQPDGLEGFLSRWRASFDDLGDHFRPQFAGNASLSAMLFLVGANDLPSLQRLLALLGLLFGRPDLNWEEEFTTFDVPTLIESGMSTPPDWVSVRLGEVIPPFQRLGEILMQAMGMLSREGRRPRRREQGRPEGPRERGGRPGRGARRHAAPHRRHVVPGGGRRRSRGPGRAERELDGE